MRFLEQHCRHACVFFLATQTTSPLISQIVIVIDVTGCWDLTIAITTQLFKTQLNSHYAPETMQVPMSVISVS